MLKHYIKASFRFLKRNRAYSVLNILGLSLGFTCCLLLGNYVFKELTMDRRYPDHKQMYRLVSQLSYKANTDHLAISPAGLAPALVNDHQAATQYCRLKHADRFMFSYQGQKVYSIQGFLADQNFFSFFDFKPINALPNGHPLDSGRMVIDFDLAKKLFGKDYKQCVGKWVQVNEQDSLQVSALLNLNNKATHLKGQVILSFSSYQAPDFDPWFQFDTYSFIKVAKGTDRFSMAQMLDQTKSKHLPEKWRRPDFNAHFAYQPISKVYLNTDLKYDSFKHGNPRNLRLITVIGLFTLFVVLFNYVNLATARVARRRKEIGVRKTLGATKKQLIVQHLAESAMLSTISLLIAVVLADVAGPYFGMIGQGLFEIDQPLTLLGFVLVLLIATIVGAFAGIYPAVLLAGLKPITMVKQVFTNNAVGGNARHLLVGLQLSTAIGMTAFTIMVMQQLQFARNQDLGFELSNVIMADLGMVNASNQYDSLAQLLKQSPHIEQVGGGNAVLIGAKMSSFGVKVNNNDQVQSIIAAHAGIDPGYFDAVRLEMDQGTFVMPDTTQGNNVVHILVNQTFVKMAKWKEPLGQTVQFPGSPADAPYQFKVAGVVKDFYYNGSLNAVGPTIIYPMDNKPYMLIRFAPGKRQQAQQHLEKSWAALMPNTPVVSELLEESFNEYYAQEEALLELLTFFSVVIISLSLIGIIGLTLFTVEQKRHELIVRKINGAGLQDILLLMNRDYLYLLVVSSVVAWPFSFIASTKWLNQFDYHTAIDSQAFFMATALVLVLTICMVSYYALRAALSKPILSLR